MADRTNEQARNEFYAALVDLHCDAGRPSYSEIARAAYLGRGVVQRILDGVRVPDHKTLALLVTALGGEAQVPRFQALLKRIYVPTVDPQPGAPANAAATERHESLEISYFDSTREFYSALADRLASAEEEICVTYIRQLAPNRYTDEAAARYFASLLEWSTVPHRRVLRVIGVPARNGSPNQRFLEWLREHQAATRRNLAYEAKVFEWTVDTDSINMALIDGRTAFLTFSGISGQQISGLAANSELFTARWRGYFNQLWSHAKALDDYLDAYDLG
ncbi:hypothetical protein [Catellatospora citrea]|nr:hypothetical protein [Catellatospora citrea]RKE06257.1 hypothetical protein C8E86_1076 [Catellatospora citrea]